MSTLMTLDDADAMCCDENVVRKRSSNALCSARVFSTSIGPTADVVVGGGVVEGARNGYTLRAEAHKWLEASSGLSNICL